LGAVILRGEREMAGENRDENRSGAFRKERDSRAGQERMI
jgi:hypothetical protein